MLEDSFGKVLQELRREKKVTQEDLAHNSGLDRTYISLLERGLRIPTLTTIFKISTSLEIQPEEFVRLVKEYDEDSK